MNEMHVYYLVFFSFIRGLSDLGNWFVKRHDEGIISRINCFGRDSDYVPYGLIEVIHEHHVIARPWLVLESNPVGPSLTCDFIVKYSTIF